MNHWRAYHPDPEYYAERADGLLASALDGTEPAVEVFRRHDAALTSDGARSVVAAEHGFASWQALQQHVAQLPDDPFAQAFQAVEAQDVDGLAAVVERFPELASATGTNGNDLLGMGAATCDERLVRVLLDRGADPARANAHGWTALHQAAYSNLPYMARMLLDAGAPATAEARGDGGTPLIVALFWGNREVAELLADHGIHPRNLRAAAGLDDVQLIDELLASGPSAAGAQRGFYRPHGGFPAWRPSSDAQEILDEALTWASRNGRLDAVDALLRHGANVEADVYRGTPLIWAAAVGRADAVQRLLERGADPSRRATFGGPKHGQGVTALHMAAENGHLDVIRTLLDAGADTSLRDDLYDSPPAGWADHGGHDAARELLGGVR